MYTTLQQSGEVRKIFKKKEMNTVIPQGLIILKMTVKTCMLQRILLF